MPKRIVLTPPAIAVGVALVAVASGFGVYHFTHQDDQVQVVSAPTAQPSAPPAPLAPLAPGQYLFDVLGSGPLPVSVEVEGNERITVIRAAKETVPEFRLVLNRQGDTYTGTITDPAGIVCKADSQAHEAEVKYSVRADGSHGLVEVQGNPCNTTDPNIPLKFDLVPAPAV